MRVLSGVQPSGTLHVGNYFGALKQHIELQEEHECFYFIANYHSLTTIQDPERLRQLTLDVAPVLLGSGERLFDGVEDLGFEPVEVLHSPLATHIRYRVGR